MHFPVTSALAVLSFLGSSAASSNNYKNEKCPVNNLSDLVSNGEPIGDFIKIGNITTYITGDHTDTAILHLTDVFGLPNLANKLLADSFARAGYLTVAPDLFQGSPAPADLNDPSWDQDEFLRIHSPNITDPVIEKTISYMIEELNVSRILIAGYCFGGRYMFRFLNGRGGEEEGDDDIIQAGFTAHPSFMLDDEITAIVKPATVAAGELDELMPVAKRHEVEKALGESGVPYSLSLYSGAPHGFGSSVNMSDPQQRFAHETAFIQAVRWFEYWNQEKE